jgi:uncharacterized hydrophobic protein (TIGR00271 family)
VRQLFLTVPHEKVADVREAGDRHQAALFAQMDAGTGDAGRTLLVFEVPNARLEGFVAAMEHVDDLRAIFSPQGIVSLRPPADEAEDQMIDIQPRSPLEVFLGGLQSIGSWTGLLGYSAVGAIIVWIGLFTETVFLLVAAMLIAPFAGPAMTLAIATARGDKRLLTRSLLRYFAALAVSIAVALALSLVFDQQIATGLMVETSMRSTVSLLLPLAAGVAGALNLVQSERSSLVSGAATGMLIAAALAPPAGLVGMGLAIGEFDIVLSSLWALGIQIVGINLAGYAVFRLYGMSNQGARYPRGRPWLTAASLAGSVAALGALLTIQFSSIPEFQQSSIAQRISASVIEKLEQRGDIGLVSIESHFTRSRPHGDNPVWVSVDVEARLSEQEKRALARRLSERIEAEFGVRALVDLTALS